MSISCRRTFGHSDALQEVDRHAHADHISDRRRAGLELRRAAREAVKRTSAIMLHRPGTAAVSDSSRPQSTPMPDGPHILWLLNARKSAPRLHVAEVVARTGSRPRSRSRPSCAASHSRCTGVIVPSTLLIAVKLSTFAPSSSSRAASCRAWPWPRAATPPQGVMPFSWAIMCRARMYAWCCRCEHHHVATLEIGAAPAVGDEVQRLGGVLGEDRLVIACGFDEPTHLGPRPSSRWPRRPTGTRCGYRPATPA